MDNEILEILKRLESRFDGLETRFDGLETRFDNLESNQKEMKEDIKEIKQKVNSVYNQTADLTEFKTEVNMKLDGLRDLENVTKENCLDIAKLKSVK